MTVGSLVSVTEAAEIIGCTAGRVRQLLIDGRLQGIKANERAWLIPRRSVERFANNRPPKGRRPKLAKRNNVAR